MSRRFERGGALSALVDTAAMAASWPAHDTSGPKGIVTYKLG
jgi:acyl-coenzyme A thioesterase PaaI-like protein